jgi:exopolysaccharide biosynthesis polyprenyl glycosylphosphotransferase
MSAAATRAAQLPLVQRGGWQATNGQGVAELLRMLDAASALGALALVFLAANLQHMPLGLDAFLLQRVSVKNVVVVGVFLLVWRQIFVLFGLYDATRALDRRDERTRVIAACSIGSVTLLALPLVSTNAWFQPWHILAVGLISIAGALVSRQLVWLGAQTSSPSVARRVLIVGTGPRAVKLYEDTCMRQPSRYVLVGFVDTVPHVASDFVRKRLLATVERIDQVLMEYAVDEVLVALPIKSCYEMIQQVLDKCERAGVQANYLADVFRTSLARPRYEATDRTPIIAMKVVTDDNRMVVKRAIDIVGALGMLTILSPLMLAIAAAVKLTSPGPIIYSQVRHGLRRKRFAMLKFRTMVADAESRQAALEDLNEATGPVFKIKRDPRLTPLGGVLRRLSLDELPQLLNVLKGDMSLVGPRPLPTRDVAHFGEAWLIRRFSVPQGLTGLWQISGRSDLSFDDWMELDLEYIDQWSLGLDARILIRTLPAVLSGRGAK